MARNYSLPKSHATASAYARKATTAPMAPMRRPDLTPAETAPLVAASEVELEDALVAVVALTVVTEVATVEE